MRMDGIVRAVSAKRFAPLSPMRLGVAVGIVLGVSALLPESVMQQAQAQSGGNWAPGYDYQVGYQQSSTSNPDVTYEFTRGVDVWEDGIVWYLTGTDALNDDLETCTRCVIRIKDPRTDATTFSNTITIDTASARLWGAYTPNKMWPTDLALFDPNGSWSPTCSTQYVRGVAVGGWRAAVADNFETAESSEEIPTCSVGTNVHSWVYVVDGERGFPNPVPYSTFFIPNSTYLTTFVAKAGVNPSYVRVKSTDTSMTNGVNCSVSGATLPELVTASEFATGGTFKGIVDFRGGCARPVSNDPDVTIQSRANSADAFVSLHTGKKLNPHLLVTQEPVLVIASTGDDGIESVSIDRLTGEIVVCGFIGGADADFDPDPCPDRTTAGVYSFAGGSSGGESARDWFVASYSRRSQAEMCNGQPQSLWKLNWFRVGNVGAGAAETARGVIADVSGHVYMTGSIATSSPENAEPFTYGFGPVLLQHAVLDPNSPPYYYPQQKWLRTTPMNARGLDICVDGIGRPVVVGSFAGPSFLYSPAFSYPGSGTITNPGGRSGFVQRLDPDDGLTQWGQVIGGAERDECTHISVCQYNSAKLAVCGDFRGTAAFGPNSTPLSAGLKSDGFVAFADHEPELGPGGVEVKRHITIALDQLIDPYADGELTPLESEDWEATAGPIADVLQSQDWAPGTVSVQVLMYGAFDFNLFIPVTTDPTGGLPSGRDHTLQTVPVTTIRGEKEGRWVAERLRWDVWHRRAADLVVSIDPPVAYGEHEVTRVARLAADYFGYDPFQTQLVLFSFPDHADYRHMLIPTYQRCGIVDSLGQSIDPKDFIRVDVRNAITGVSPAVPNPFIDQINGIALTWNGLWSDPDFAATRASIKQTAALSKVQFTAVGPSDPETNLAMVANVAYAYGAGLSPWIVANPPNDTLPAYRRLLELLFLRMTVCPSDFNRDGMTQGAFPGGVDAAQFINAYQQASNPLHIYADWNFDGLYPGTDPSIHSDAAKFKAGLLTTDGGNLPPNDCPNN